jgi:hypothetical protein
MMAVPVDLTTVLDGELAGTADLARLACGDAGKDTKSLTASILCCNVREKQELYSAATKGPSASTYKSGRLYIFRPFAKKHAYFCSEAPAEVDLNGLDIGIAK